MEDAEVIQIRKDRMKSLFKDKFNLIVYAILAFIIYLAVKIRTGNLDKLRDISTGTWTLGPDLDPFLFLRWSKYIVENGTLFAVDLLRSAPLGYATDGELLLHPYLMAWFHNFAVFFGSESITHSAVLYPVFFFAITLIAFFLLTRKIFLEHLGNKKASIIGLIASFFFMVFTATSLLVFL